MSMKFHSTNGQSPAVNLQDALLAGQAPDRGLYLPAQIPRLPRETFASFAAKPYHQIAFDVLSQYTRGVIPDPDLARMCREAYDFGIPLEVIQGRKFLMRLDQGPTASFKDFAARMMARMFGFFLNQTGGKLTILTATSGDTGAAVARAFHGIPGVRVLVLFPVAEVSASQRKLMTTLQGNVRTLAVDGKFDDCQAMVKQAFADPDLRHIPLSSANSINIGRLLPQCVYYFFAASRLADTDEPVVFSVPSGNFGDMMGAVLAREMGLPVRKIIAPVNDNDAFPRFLATGVYQKVSPSRNSVSNAMNVGHPSNLARLTALYGGHMDETGKIHRQPDMDRMRRDLFSSSISDQKTRSSLKSFWEQYNILLEPHGVVAWQGFLDWAATEDMGQSPIVMVETANPAKFPEEVEKVVGWPPDVPFHMQAAMDLPEDFDRMTVEYGRFKAYLMKHQAS